MGYRNAAQTFPFDPSAWVDITPHTLTWAKQRDSEYLAYGTVNGLPFTDAAFDMAVSLDVLCHSAVDDSLALMELYRVVKPGGKLLLNLPAFEWMRSQHDAVIRRAHRYTASGLMRKAARVRFRVDARRYRHSLLFPLMVVQRLLRKAPKQGMPKSAIVRY